MNRLKNTLACLALAAVVVFIPATAVSAAEDNTTTETTRNNYNASSTVAFVVVDGYSIEGGMLTAGGEVTLNLNLSNVSETMAATNTVVNITTSNGMVYPVYGEDNQVYIGTVGAGSSQTVAIPLSVSSKFAADSVDLTITTNYAANGNKLTNTSTIAIPASGGNAIGVKRVEVGSHASVGGRSLVSINYVNQTTHNITDAELVVEGNVIPGTEEISMDTISSNKDYLRDYYVAFAQDGSQEITLTLKYTDGEGNKCQESLGTYTVYVSKAYDIEDEETVNNANMISFIGKIATLVIGLIVLLSILLYAKRK